jgi:hypothetical protein
MSNPCRHDATVVPGPNRRGFFTCCTDTKPVFTEIWNQSGSKVSSMVFGTPSQVLDRIIDHLTAGRTDEHTRTAIETERSLVALGGTVENGLRALAKHLPGVTVQFVEPPALDDTSV